MFGLDEELVNLGLIGLGVIFGLVFLGMMFRRVAPAKLKDAWEQAAWRLKLEFRAPGGPATWRIDGNLKGFPFSARMVAVEAEVKLPEGKKKKKKKKKKKPKPTQFLQTHISLEVAGAVPVDLSLRARRAGESSWVGVRTGDSRFDRLVEVRGEAVSALSRLNGTVRERVLKLIPKHRVSLDEGRLNCTQLGVVSNATRLTNLIKALVALAQALRGNGEKPEYNLMQACQNDSNHAVRQVCFSTMLNRFPYKNETYRAATALLGAADPLTTMLAGMQAGEAGIDKVRQAATSNQLPAEFRVRAVEHLINEHPHASGNVIASVVGPIVEHIPEREAVRLAEQVSGLQQDVAQRALLSFLDKATAPVQLAALVGLGQIGDESTLPALQTFLTEARSGSKAAVVARQTIAAVKGRHLPQGAEGADEQS